MSEQRALGGVRGSDHKTLLDTIHIACANAESELAAILAPRLREPAEANKVLAHLFAAQGAVRVNGASITVILSPAANANESVAIAALQDAPRHDFGAAQIEAAVIASRSAPGRCGLPRDDVPRVTRREMSG